MPRNDWTPLNSLIKKSPMSTEHFIAHIGANGRKMRIAGYTSNLFTMKEVAVAFRNYRLRDKLVAGKQFVCNYVDILDAADYRFNELRDETLIRIHEPGGPVYWEWLNLLEIGVRYAYGK